MREVRPELASYEYRVPRKRIAQSPTEPRDSAKLLVYRRSSGRISYDIFRNLERYLPDGSVLVFNETKVIPARFKITKETGGKVDILFLSVVRGKLQVLADRKLLVGSKVKLSRRHWFRVASSDDRCYYLKPSFPIRGLDSILNMFGTAPLPPYIKPHASDARLRKQYQSVFAKTSGSVAAPTASLHFTKRLLRRLRSRGYDLRFITLHVGLGTFAPVTKEQLASGALHEERYSISSEVAQALSLAKRHHKPIIAVGTTVVRALESASDSRGRIVRRSGKTRLFIREGYRFRFVDGIITNFHVPRSSLMMLTSAFLSRRELLSVYRKALRRRFRFFSFGDGMLAY